MIHPSDLFILSLSDPHKTTALVGAKESESDQVAAMTSDKAKETTNRWAIKEGTCLLWFLIFSYGLVLQKNWISRRGPADVRGFMLPNGRRSAHTKTG